MVVLSFLLAVAGLKDDTLEALLEGLRSEDPAVRTKAAGGVLSGWKRWTKEDLARLDDASMDSDPEVNARATDLRSRISLRRTLGITVVEKVAGADEAFHTGDDAAKLLVLTKARDLWRSDELGADHLRGLELLASRAAWSDPKVLERFLKKEEGGRVFAIPTDPQARVRLRAKEVELLADGGAKQARQVAEFLGDDAPEVRATALRVIAEMKAKEQAPKVAALLRDKSAGVRGEALALLGGWGAREYSTDLVELLGDPNGHVRWRAAEALAGWGQKDVAPRIAKLLRDPYAPSRAEAASALAGFGAREFAPEIAPLLGDPHAAVRRAAAFAVGRLGAGEFAGAVEKLLQDRDPYVRLTAAQALGQIGEGVSMETIVPLLKDGDPEVRFEAAWVLGRVAPREAGRRVAGLLDHPDAEVRHGVAHSLGHLGAREFRPPIVLLLADPSAWVRSEAVLALGRLGEKEDAEAIGRRLGDADRKVRINAALALGDLGAGDPGEVLAGAERDKDRLLRLASTLSLMRLGLRDVAAQREALREIATDDLAFACLGTSAAEAFSRAHARDAWDRLGRPLALTRSVESWGDLTDALSGAGLALRVEVPCGLGRLDRRLQVTGRQALEWLLGRLDPPAIVLEGRTLRLMDRRAALVHWQKRLDGK